MFKIMRCSIFLIIIFFLIGCSHTAENYAPVVNGWEQPAHKQGGYKVQSGDTLYSIAWAYGLDYKQLAKINNLQEPYRVEVGQEIFLVPQKMNTNVESTKTQKVKTDQVVSKPLKSMNINAWQWPAVGKVVSTFSLSMPVNKGIDIAGSAGEVVKAANTGKVVYSGNGIPGYGNLIIIKHNDLYLSAYAHNKKNLVSEGQQVRSGQKIAIMGLANTGRYELHFEIRYKGKPINPLSKLPKK
tara:strand:- start:1773 stop:2495 length:723 start_codon:yes stop_codon:yes gene_type:complete